MPYDPLKHHRHSIRLKGYDYSQAGAYFLTLLVKNRECLLGEIINGQFQPNDFGRVIETFWDELPRRYPEIELDAFVVMPNHVHGIIVIVGPLSVRAIHELPLQLSQEPPLPEPSLRAIRRQMLLPKVVGYFKMNTAKRLNQMRGIEGAPFWHRNYYEHIIRNEADLNRIREYIQNNPTRWADDQLHPEAPPNQFNR